MDIVGTAAARFKDSAGRTKYQPERQFGALIAALALAAGLVRLWSAREARVMIGTAIALAIVAVVAPAVLRWPLRAWLALGAVLHRVVTPVVIALLYGLAVVPTGLAMRLCGARPLMLGFDRNVATYWTPRVPPGPTASSMRNQF